MMQTMFSHRLITPGALGVQLYIGRLTMHHLFRYFCAGSANGSSAFVDRARWLTPSWSNRKSSTRTRRKKSFQSRDDLGDQSTSAKALSRGKTIYSTCLKFGMYSVHTLACAPRMCC